MTPGVKPLVAGNWKMNGLRRQGLLELAAIAAGYDAPARARVDVAVLPPATLIYAASAALIGSGIAIGGQDCHQEAEGAFTGSISAAMLADAGASLCVVGHSERRTLAGDSDAIVRAKAARLHAQGLTAILCVGETRAEREAGQARAVVEAQLAGSLPDGATAENLVIAYEPVWAIGTGLTATPGDVADMHAAIRARLVAHLPEGEGAKTRILYGGSVKPGNAKELMAVANVDGALVGGASLKAVDFLAIIAAL